MGRFVPADAEMSHEAPAEEPTVTVLLSQLPFLNGIFRHILYLVRNTYIVPQCWTQLSYKGAENRTGSLTH